MSSLSIDLSHSAVRAGESLVGLVTLGADRLCRLRRLRVEAVGLELLGASSRYRPAVYRHPVPRPWGRTRSGSRRLDYRAGQVLTEAPTEIEPGRHTWPFSLAVPPEALPTYGGSSVVVEHEVSALAEFDDAPPLRAWAPTHVWLAPDGPPAAEPLALRVPADGGGSLADRLARGLRGPLSLAVTGPNRVLPLGSVIELSYEVVNRTGRAARHLELEVWAAERTRHRAATDETRYPIDRREIALSAEPEQRGTVDWAVPAAAAPTLRGKRFSVRWELHAAVTLAWAPGVSGSVELVLCDPST